MAGLDLTGAAAILKQHYVQKPPENEVYKDHPFMAMLKKYEKFGGESRKIPLISGNPQGRSATFSSALANQTNAQLKAYFITRNHDYGIATIDGETLEASIGDMNAFIEAATVQIDGSMQAVGNSLGGALYRDGEGWIGQVLAEPAETAGTFSFTLLDPQTVTGFEVGQTLNIWSAITGGTQRNSDGSDVSWPIAAVNRTTGVITLTGTYNSSGTIAASDYIFVEGDRGNKVKGLDAWLPATVTSTPFFGVDRTADPTRLAGIRYDGSAQPIEEALIDAASLIAREGGKPDHCFLNYAQYANLEKALGSKVQYVDITTQYVDVGFRGMMINGPKGPIKVIPDQDCLPNVAFMLQMNTWELNSIGKAPKILKLDGLDFLRLSSADAVEARCGYYAQLACFAPGWNGRVTLQS